MSTRRALCESRVGSGDNSLGAVGELPHHPHQTVTGRSTPRPLPASIRAGPRFIAVIDFEATCKSEHDPNPHEGGWFQEIIEIACAVIDTQRQSVAPAHVFHTYCMPTRPLTDFTVELTGITQRALDEADAPRFTTAYCRWLLWFEEHFDVARLMDPSYLLVVTIGNWDLETALPAQLERTRIGRRPHFLRRWCNLNRAFRSYAQRHFVRGRGVGLRQMAVRLGVPLAGRQHSGMDDVWNTVRIILKMLLGGHVFRGTNRR